MAHDADPRLIALAALRLSPLFLVLLVVTTLGLRPKPPASPSTASITNIVVADVRPRRALILTILTFAALTYLLDTVLVIVISVVDHVRHGSTPQWRGIEVADAAGVLAFFSLAIVGSAKEKKGVVFWTRKRVKAFAFFALAFDIAHLVLLLLAIPIFPRKFRSSFPSPFFILGPKAVGLHKPEAMGEPRSYRNILFGGVMAPDYSIIESYALLGYHVYLRNPRHAKPWA